MIYNKAFSSNQGHLASQIASSEDFLKNKINNFSFYYFSWYAEEVLYTDMIHLYRSCCTDLDQLQTICSQQLIIIA